MIVWLVTSAIILTIVIAAYVYRSQISPSASVIAEEAFETESLSAIAPEQETETSTESALVPIEREIDTSASAGAISRERQQVAKFSESSSDPTIESVRGPVQSALIAARQNLSGEVVLRHLNQAEVNLQAIEDAESVRSAISQAMASVDPTAPSPRLVLGKRIDVLVRKLVPEMSESAGELPANATQGQSTESQEQSAFFWHQLKASLDSIYRIRRAEEFAANSVSASDHVGTLVLVISLERLRHAAITGDGASFEIHLQQAKSQVSSMVGSFGGNASMYLSELESMQGLNLTEDITAIERAVQVIEASTSQNHEGSISGS